MRLAQVAVGGRVGLDFLGQSVVVGRNWLYDFGLFGGRGCFFGLLFFRAGGLGRFQGLGEVRRAENVGLGAAFSGARFAFGGLAGADGHGGAGGLFGDRGGRFWLLGRFQGLGQMGRAERFGRLGAAFPGAGLAFGGLAGAERELGFFRGFRGKCWRTWNGAGGVRVDEISGQGHVQLREQRAQGLGCAVLKRGLDEFGEKGGHEVVG